MFYAQQVLTRKGPLAKIWLAATFQNKLTKAQVFTTDIVNACQQIAAPEIPMALRLSACLLLGVSRIHQKQTGYVLEEASDALTKLQLTYQMTDGRVAGGTVSGSQGVGAALTSASATAAYGSITFSEHVVGAAEATRTVASADAGEQHSASALLLLGDYWNGLLGFGYPASAGTLANDAFAGQPFASEAGADLNPSPFHVDAQQITIDPLFGNESFQSSARPVEVVRRDEEAEQLRAPTPFAGSPPAAGIGGYPKSSTEDQALTPEQFRSVPLTLPEPPPLDLSLPTVQPEGATYAAAALDWSLAAETAVPTSSLRRDSAEPSSKFLDETGSIMNTSTLHRQKRRKSTGRRPLAPQYHVDSQLELATAVIRRALADTTDTLRRPIIDDSATELDGISKLTDLLQRIVPSQGAQVHSHIQKYWTDLSQAATAEPRDGNDTATLAHAHEEQRSSALEPAAASPVLGTLDDSNFSFGLPTTEISRLSALSAGASPVPGDAAEVGPLRLERAMASPAKLLSSWSTPGAHSSAAASPSIVTHRTERLLDYLVAKCREQPQNEALSIQKLWHAEAASRRVIARSMLELLVLATQQRIVVQQAAPYDDIEIRVMV